MIYIYVWQKANQTTKQINKFDYRKYPDLSVSFRAIISLSLQLRQIIDLLAFDKSRYLAEPRQIVITNYYSAPNTRQLPDETMSDD